MSDDMQQQLALAEPKWSPQQEAVISEFSAGGQHFVVVARAGSGKTTILLKGMSVAPEGKRLVCAFSKIIADELNMRVQRDSLGNIEARTLHAIGYQFVRQFWQGVRPSFNSERADKLAEAVCGAKAPDAIKKIVSKLHTKGREMAPHAEKLGDLVDIMAQFELEPDAEWEGRGFDAAYVEQKALDCMEMAAAHKPLDGTIDGSDMIFLPIRNGWLHPIWDVVAVDEAQDMTTAQLEIAQGCCSGRIVVIGDPCQAIFGFRGADSNSLYRLKAELNAKELPLTVTYRCGKRIVAEAQRYVPDFTAGDDNPEGAVEHMRMSQLMPAVEPGDFVLSRINAPLVSIAMSLLKRGTRTVIAGRDVGKGLQGLITKFKAKSIPDLMAKISTWEQRETDRVIKRYQLRPAVLEQRTEAIRDQADMLTSLAEGAGSVYDVVNNITTLFADKSAGAVVTCSSVHRAKGLEANRVFVLADTLRADKQEEVNITYVAITRAKKVLTYVAAEDKPYADKNEGW